MSTATMAGLLLIAGPLAERLTPITYIAWSLWLIATGVALLA